MRGIVFIALVLMSAGGLSAADADVPADAQAVRAETSILEDTDRYILVSAARRRGSSGDSLAVDQLVVALRDARSRVRLAAVKALGGTKDARAVQALINALHDKSPDVRQAAAIALGTTKDPTATEPLISRLSADDLFRNVQQAAGWALVQIGEPAVEPLIRALRTTSRNIAALALGEIGDARAVGPLIQPLKDGEFYIGREARQALAQIGQPAVEPLITALKEATDYRRELVVNTLGDIKDPRAVEPLAGVLNDPDAMIALQAADALAKMNDPRGLQYLVSKLDDKGSLASETALKSLCEVARQAIRPLMTVMNGKHQWSRELAARALGATGDPQAVDALISALKDRTSGIRATAATAIGYSKDPRAVELLIAALKDGDRDVRLSAIASLADIGDLRASEPLIAMLKDEKEDAPIREKAIAALGRMRAPGAIEPLFGLLKGKDHALQELAAAALAQIGQPTVERLLPLLKDGDRKIRQLAVRALGQIRDPKTLEPLTSMLKDETFLIRQYAVAALVPLGWKPTSSEQMAIWLLTAGELEEATIQEPETLDAVLSLLGSDLEAVAANYRFLIMLGKDRMESTLTAALMEHGDSKMCVSLLNCGKPALEAAAKTWASVHGYEIIPGTNYGDMPRWGSTR